MRRGTGSKPQLSDSIPWACGCRWAQARAQRGHPAMRPPEHAGKAPPPPNPHVHDGFDAHFNRFAGPDHERRIHPDRRTICGSNRPDPTGSRRRLEAPAPSVVSSRAAEFKADIVQPLGRY